MAVTMQKNYYTVCKSSLENLPYFLMQKNGQKYEFMQLSDGLIDSSEEIRNNFNERTGYRIAGQAKPIIIRRAAVKYAYYFAAIRIEPEYLDVLKFEAPLVWVRYDSFNTKNTEPEDLEALRKEFRKSGWAKYFKKNGLAENTDSAKGHKRDD